MNKDILQGAWLETKGRVKEMWGKLSANELDEIEGKNAKLLGILRKQYGFIRDKDELEYKDTVALAGIVSKIREVFNRKENYMAIAFIARYGQPLSAKNQESPTKKWGKYSYGAYSYFDSRLSRRNTHFISR